jgi:hypothetical protein
MIEAAKEKTNQEKLQEINNRISQTCFEFGRNHFEANLRAHDRENLEIRFTNEKKELQKILELIAKEQKLKAVNPQAPQEAPKDPHTLNGLEGLIQ